MNRSIFKTIAIAALAAGALAPLLGVSQAEAGGRGKDYFVQEYTFDQPMNGFQGFSGAYYCSYIKQPKDVCSPTGQCKRVWSLVQSCQ